jgi:hypothetical protein
MVASARVNDPFACKGPEDQGHHGFANNTVGLAEMHMHLEAA